MTSGKGGTGKSTVAALLGRALSARGLSVLLLEFDSGLRGLDLMLGVSDRVVYDLGDVLEGRCRPGKAIVEVGSDAGHLHLAAASTDRHYLPNRENLSRLLRSLQNCYDYLIIDAAAGLGEDFEIAKEAADLALIVVNAEPVSVRDGAKASALLDGKPMRLVINRFSRRQLSDDIPDLDRVIDLVGAQLISVIPDDPLIPKALGAGGEPGGDSPAFVEIKDLAGRLLGESIRLCTERLK